MGFFTLGDLSAVLLASFASLVLFSSTRKNQHLPPSPPCDPIIGHARSIPSQDTWKAFAAWGKKYGDIIYVHVFGNPMVILHSASVARDLLDKRSANFSDRPKVYVLGDLIGWSPSLPFLPYGDRFRWQRKLIQRYFDPHAVKMFRPIQSERVQILLSELLENPEDFYEATKRMVTSMILKATYGYTVHPTNDPIFTLLERASTATGEALGEGGAIVDLFPTLRYVPVWFPSWFPGVLVKRHALRARELVEEVMSRPLKELKERKAAGHVEPSFVSKMLDEYDVEQREDPLIAEDIKALGAVTYTAGFETTYGNIFTFMMMMILHPEIAKKAQGEIDNVTGGQRLPTFDDHEQLPYIGCIMKEVFRVSSVLPLSLPHQPLQDEKYGEWSIPKGTMVISNIWQMMNDEQYFPNPELFDPERYLLKSTRAPKASAESDKFNDPSQLIFGFGRRICPGRFFAEDAIWLTMACTLAVFDFMPYVDQETGKEVLPENAFVSELTRQPKSFKCRISPRSEKHEQLIRQEATYRGI